METKKYLDEAGLSYYHSKIKGLIDEKVDAEEGKGLSSNDFTDSDKTKLEELPGITTIGANLDLTDGVLSATGGGAAYTAGTGLELNGNEFSIDNTVALKSEIPTVNNATLTVQKNGAMVDTFTANASLDKTINITVPTTAADVSALPASTKYGASIVLSINSTTYVVTATLKDQDGNTLGSSQTIDLPLESVVVSGSYDSQTKEVVLTLQSGSTIRFSVADLVSGLQTEINAQNKLSADLVDDSTTTNKFVTASDKTTWSGKQDALTAGSNITISDNTISATDTTYSNFVGATSLADGSAGLVPAPLIADASEYLKGDGTWDTPPNTTYSDFTGATSSVAGSAGLVPAPAAGDEGKYLKGDGTWGSPTGATVLDFYPVGSYYETSDTTFDPNVSWGGTWVEDTAGRVLVAVNSGTFSTVGGTGGEETHTLTTTEMPSHNHALDYTANSGGIGTSGTYGTVRSSGNQSIIRNNTVSTTGELAYWGTENRGGGGAHNNLQPYTVVKRWHRTA